MKINKLIPIILIIFAFGFRGYSQKFAGKIETGYMQFQFHTIQVDPGPNWIGYNLEDEKGIAPFNFRITGQSPFHPFCKQKPLNEVKYRF